MDWQRSGLIAGILIVLYLLLLEWNQFQENARPAITEQAAPMATQRPQAVDQPLAVIEEGIPEVSDTFDQVDNVAAVNTSGLITVKTDVLDMVIDTYGGDIIHAGLPTFLASQDEPDVPFVILNKTNNYTYIAQSGLIGKNGTDTSSARPVFVASSNSYTLNSGEESLTVDLVYQQGDVKITKRFIFKRGDFLVDVKYLIDNQSAEAWSATLFGQIKRDSKEPETAGGSGGMGMQPYLGAAITTKDKNFKKVEFDDLDEKPFKVQKNGGWVAMVQHYFISAWIPDQSSSNNFTLRKVGNKDLYTLGFTQPALQLAAGESGEINSQFYVGPKDQYRLEEVAPYLDLTVDYGWLWWIAKPIFWVLTHLHDILGNWGWSIIFLTLGIKIVFFRLSATSYRSMANMRKLQPEMARLKDLYGDDRQKMSQETMALYKKEKVNPMGGCLPMLIQMPVFIALYWVLLESVELRHAPFMLWIVDLSVKDPLFILPLLMGASMFVQMQLNPTPPDPMQAKVMKIMPIAFTGFFMFFPAGLVLYWTVNNILSILQQWVITRRIEAAS